MPGSTQLGPLGAGRVLDVALKIFRAHGWTLIKASALVVVPVQLLSALLQSSATPSPEERLRLLSPAPGLSVPSFDSTALVGIVIAGLVAAAGTALATATCVHAVSEVLADRAPSWSASLRFAWSRLPALLWLSILSAVLILVGALGAGIGSLYLAVAWFVAPAAFIIEGAAARRALGRSFSLVRGRWQPTAGIYFLSQMLVSTVAYVMIVPLLVALLQVDEGGSELQAFVLQFAISGGLGVVSTPFLACVVSVTYFDLRARKEGLDLVLAADNLGLEAPAGATAPPLTPGQFLPMALRSGSHPPFWPPPPGWQPPPPPAPQVDAAAPETDPA